MFFTFYVAHSHGSAAVTELLPNDDPLARAWTTSATGEILNETNLTFTGSLPHWLTGEYLLASSSVFEIHGGSHNLTHAFDGFSKILRWKLNGLQSPTFRARMLNSSYLSKSHAAGDIVPCSNVGGSEPPFSNMEKAKAPWAGTTDNFNVNIHNFGPAAPFVALSDVSDEQAAAAKINPNTLVSETFTWSDKWAHPIADRIAPAHPRIVPDGSGDTVGLIARLDPLAVGGIGQHSLILYRTDSSSSDRLVRNILHEIRVPKLPYVHSIGVTQNFAIICSGPLFWDISRLLVGDDASQSWEWDAKVSTTIYKLPLDPSAPVTMYSAPSFFSFHHVNAWENKDGSLEFDILVNQNLGPSSADPSADFSFSVLRHLEHRDKINGTSHGGRLTRFKLFANLSVISEELNLTDAAGRQSRYAELPGFNTNFAGKPYCFVYLWCPQASGDLRWSNMALLKKDTCNATAPVLFWRQDGHFPGEPTFVGQPDGREDDGVLLTAVHNSSDESNYLLVLNAATMKPIAEIYLPLPSFYRKTNRLLAFGLHGMYSNTSSLA